MLKNNKSGYILLINVILISLMGLFIPLMIQQQYINYRILNSRIKVLENKVAVESAVEYQRFLLKNNKLVNDEIFIHNDLKINISGKEEENQYYLEAESRGDIPYICEVTVSKDNLRIINKKIYRRN